MAKDKTTVSLRGKKLTYTIKYTIELDNHELEEFICDEMDQLNGMGSAEIEDVEIH